MDGRRRLQRDCPVCGGTEGDVLHHQTFVLPDGHPLASGYDVTACPGCGFVFADTQALQQDYDHLYSLLSIYSSRPEADAEVSPPWEMERLRRTARDLASVIPVTSHVVDLGSGSGAMLVALRERGFDNAAGVDPADACVEVMKRRGFPAYRGSLFNLPSAVGAPDAVLLSHVLEHVRDLQPAMRALRSWLREGAVLYVEVPDATRYPDYLFAPFQDFNTEHINHFSPLTMARLLESAGFQVESAGRKEIRSSEDKPYPALYGFARAATDKRVPEGRDDELRPAVERYIKDSRRFLDRMNGRLEHVLSDERKVIVWGTGQLAFKLLSETCLARAPIEVFVDGNPALQGRTFSGRPVVAPELLRSSDVPIVITTTLHAAAIEKRIRGLGLKNPVVRLDEPTSGGKEAS